jgi:hypothetical protein
VSPASIKVRLPAIEKVIEHYVAACFEAGELHGDLQFRRMMAHVAAEPVMVRAVRQEGRRGLCS